MADLAHLSVAAQLEAADPAASAPGVCVRLADPGTLFLVSPPPADLAPSDLAPPDLAPNAVRGAGPCWLWLAPDRALLAGATAAPEGFVSDISDGLATFDIIGPRAAEIVAMGGTLDPHGEVLAPGRCAQTLFAGVKVVLYASGARDRFRIHAERSLASYLLAWFTQAVSALQ